MEKFTVVVPLVRMENGSFRSYTIGDAIELSAAEASRMIDAGLVSGVQETPDAGKKSGGKEKKHDNPA